MCVIHHLIIVLLAEQSYRSTDKDATDYFRAVVKAEERSQRVLELTEVLIRLNPAHYTAWSVVKNTYTSPVTQSLN